MPDAPFCLGHVNGFQHLAVDLGGLEAQVDLGFKFEQENSNKSSTDPNTGVTVWAEPLLALYVSVQLEGSPPGSGQTLHYGLTRSKFAGGLTATDEDRDRLLGLATPHILQDIEGICRRETHDNLDREKPRML